jgi:DNA-binding NarL/FixJ family response regulator
VSAAADSVADPPRVVIADGHVPTRVGLRMALEGGGFTVVGEAGASEDAIEVTLAERPDVCLLDVDIPGGGVAAATTINAKLPETVVLMLTTSADPNELMAAIRAGALGYLPKTVSARRLPTTLRGALCGEPAIPRALVAWLLDEIRESGSRPFFVGGRRVELTVRERQVLDLLFDEVPTREVAARLGISRITVRRHVSELLHKLRARDRKDVVALLKRRQDPRGQR